MVEVPDFIVTRVLMYTLMVDKKLDKGTIKQNFQVLKDSIEKYISEINSGFISNNSQEFKDYLESCVGKIEFIKPFAIRIRSDSVRLFVNGKEIFK